MKSDNAAQKEIFEAIAAWMQKMQEYPGWKDWKRSQLGYTLRFDDEFLQSELISEFRFSVEMEREHAVITAYIELLSTAQALRDVEWYFRRFPFSRAPVSRGSHLRYCCEMYFGKFYQFRERLKNLSDAVKSATPNHGIDFGKLIKIFDKEFKKEIRERHGVHHHESFDDVGISRVSILELTDTKEDMGIQTLAYRANYRKTAREWAERTKLRVKVLDKFVEVVAAMLLEVCPFLSVYSRSKSQVDSKPLGK